MCVVGEGWVGGWVCDWFMHDDKHAYGMVGEEVLSCGRDELSSGRCLLRSNQ